MVCRVTASKDAFGSAPSPRANGSDQAGVAATPSHSSLGTCAGRRLALTVVDGVSLAGRSLPGGPGALVDVTARTSGVYPRLSRIHAGQPDGYGRRRSTWLRFPAAAIASCSLSQVSGNESALEDGALPGFSGGRASKSVTVRPGGGYPPERSVRKSAARILRGPAPVA